MGVHLLKLTLILPLKSPLSHLLLTVGGVTILYHNSDKESWKGMSQKAYRKLTTPADLVTDDSDYQLINTQIQRRIACCGYSQLNVFLYMIKNHSAVILLIN